MCKLCCKCLIVFLLLTVSAHAWRYASGTYTGDGAATKAITISPAFQPDVVIVRGQDATNGIAIIAISSMPATDSLALAGGVGFMTTCIKALNSNGFSLGALNRCNTSSIVYYYQAWGADNYGDMAVGTYTGNNTDDTDITISPPFQPALCIIEGASKTGEWKSANMSASNKTGTFTTAADSTTGIKQFNSNGFRLGTDTNANANGIRYDYVCWKANPTGLFSGTFDSTASDNRSITGFGFQPDFGWVKRDAAVAPCIRFTQNGSANPATDDSFLAINASVSAVNGIQQFLSDGMEFGNSGCAQLTGDTSQYVGFKSPTYRRRVRITE